MFKDTSLSASASTLRQACTEQRRSAQCGALSRVVTNDLYLAAYLFCEGCHIERVYRCPDYQIVST